MSQPFTRFIYCIYLTCAIASLGGVSLAVTEMKIVPNDKADGDQFGLAVDMSGDYMIIGSHEDDDMGERSGSAYIFKRQAGGWTQYAKLVAPDGTTGDQFGCSVSISSDYALIGAYRDNQNGNQAGAAYIFRLVSGVWTFVTKLTPAVPEPNSEFGNSVETDGNYAVVGAHRSEHTGTMIGAVYVFERNGMNWVEDAKLIEGDLNTAAFFGCDCAISGNTILVGACGREGTAPRTGAVYLYEHDGVSWTLNRTLTASDESEDASFGRSVAIWNQWLLIGADNADGQYPDSGAGYMFRKVSGVWEEDSQLLPMNPFPGSGFGYSVDVHSDYAVIGAPFHGDSPDDTGRAAVFELNGTEWVPHLSINASDETDGSRFGWSVAVQNEECLAGALHASDGSVESGAAYLYSQLASVPPTPTPSAFTYDIGMYDTDLAAGDLFLLNRAYGNPFGAVAVDEYILLDIYGAYWFWPGWTTEVDFESWTIPAGGSSQDMILQFDWPAVEGIYTGLKFWAGLLNAGTTELILYDMEEWGYSDK